jgi:hypothetical protein
MPQSVQASEFFAERPRLANPRSRGKKKPGGPKDKIKLADKIELATL